MRPLRVATGAMTAVTAAWIVACAGLYRRAFAPAPAAGADRAWTPTDLHLEHETMVVRTSDGLSLLAWHLPGNRSAAVVVSGGHRGHPGDVLGISAALQRAGFHVVVYGWRGTPGSDTAAHTLGVHERRDLIAAVSATIDRLGDVPVGLLGFSLGGAVSIAVAADDPRIHAVCADSAFADPTTVLAQGVRRALLIPGVVLVAPVAALLARLTGARLSDFSPVRVIGRIEPRHVLLVHGGADRSVAPRNALALQQAAGPSCDLWMLPGVGHVGAYFADRSAFVDRVVGFFERSLGTAGHETNGPMFGEKVFSS